jgi:hypothetical protein
MPVVPDNPSQLTVTSTNERLSRAIQFASRQLDSQEQIIQQGCISVIAKTKQHLAGTRISILICDSGGAAADAGSGPIRQSKEKGEKNVQRQSQPKAAVTSVCRHLMCCRQHTMISLVHPSAGTRSL